MTQPRRGLTRREWGILGGLLAGLFLLLQLLPIGPPRSNPPVVAGPSWDSPRTAELFARSCGDCHSNRTAWPWYSRVAPLSWIVANDVAEGREHLNVSEWHREQKHADEAVEEVEEGKMPLPTYLWFHPEAQLNEQELGELLRGLEATFGRREPKRRGRD